MADDVIEFTDANFQAEVLQSDVPVVVDFWAPWCGPCKMMAPTIEDLAKDNAGRAKVGKMNTDENPETPGGFGIQAIPTLILFKGGEVAGQMVGINSKEDIQAALDKL